MDKFDMRRLESDALPEDVVSFTVTEIKIPYGPLEDVRLKGTRPVYDDQENLVGFFVMKDTERAKLFLAKDTKPFGLHLTAGLDFYFTIRVDTDRKHPFGRICGTISEVPFNEYSVKVKA